ncbi:glycoside hydrolase family 9 protein [Sulfurovum sp. ST-21]|uniref:Glycoside hydrolase family 9 protein n=1 Tax=Sulfurovum indicum TaxID=2779528 RepID=A0A7M1S1N0_9BACT|nr:glycoside hydrolase family 9 protein [Sulfurovum indicum]QOR61288.1 glycoside hydrolase family 9 protein [Sulfurovum indicum]
MKKLLLYATIAVATSILWGRAEPAAHHNSLISSIFHLNNSLRDSKGVISDLKLSGSASFDDSNLDWMNNPSGSALKFNGVNDQADVIFRVDPYLTEGWSDKDIAEVSLEGWFYFDAIDPKDDNKLELLYMRQGWEYGFEIIRHPWTNKLSVYLGSHEDSGETVNNALSLRQWHHIKIIHNRTYYLLYIDGKELLKVAHGREKLNLYNAQQDIRLSFGDFHGWADEIRFNLDFDTDNDGIPNKRDPDDDGDGVNDKQDAFPLDSSEWSDNDNDGIGDNADHDDDNDGIADERDLQPLNASNANADTDGDGFSDLVEYQSGSLPNDASSSPESTLPDRGVSPVLSDRQHRSLESLIQMQKPGEVRIHAVSKEWLRLTLVPERNENSTEFIRQPVDITKAEDPAMFTVKDEQNNSLSIDKTGLKRRTFYAPRRVGDLRIAENIFIHLNQPLIAGQPYTLNVDTNLTGTSIHTTFRFEPESQLSDLLHVDPYGFRPADKKKGYLGLMMGSAGEYEPTDLNFEVVRSSDNQVVFQGTGTLEISEGWRDTFTNHPYHKVYQLDFSELTTAGEYYLRHSTGISQPFVIHSNVYRNCMNTLALGMYHQRRGEALVEPFTRFTHKATIEDQTYVYDSSDLDPFLTSLRNWGDGIKYPTTLEGQHIDISGGHMDAGDYSPYTWNSSMTAWTLITTLDVYGERVQHDNLGIPESGDGIPDLLQEFLIEINWLKDMQDPVDGGVFGMSKPKGMSYQYTMPGEMEDLTRYLSPKDTTVTGGYAAALARAARSPILKQYDPALAELLKKRAIKAWEWLEANPGMHGYHHYGIASASEGDEGHEHARAWAAIELYALTGDERYHNAFMEYHKPLLRDDGVYLMNKGYGYVNRTLALWEHDQIAYPVDADLKQTSVNRFREAVDQYVSISNKTPYDLAVNDVVKRWNIIGWFFPVSDFGWDLLLAHELYGDLDYLETAQDQIHFTLGGNPSNMSYITGMGYKRLRSIVDQESYYDGIEAPVTGLPVSPMVTGYTWSNTYTRDISQYSWPLDNPDRNSESEVYGLLETAYDGWNINGEFTIEKMAGMLTSMAILTPHNNKQYTYPEFTLTVESLANGLFQPKLNFKDGEPQNYSILWSENDQHVSADPNYLLQQDFSKPVWKLSAEVVTHEGRRWYAETRINTRDYTNTDIPLEAFSNESVSTLFHLDGSLSDSNSIMADLNLMGNAHFDNHNLYWMQTPSGSALRFDGFGDEAKTTFYVENYLSEGKRFEDIAEVSIGGLFFFDTLGPVNENALFLFSLQQSWANRTELIRYAWTKQILAALGKIQDERDDINEALSLHKWHYIQMIYNRTHYILKVDGKEIVKVTHDNGEKLLDHRIVALKFGNFYGWADEIYFSMKFDDGSIITPSN